MFKADVRLSRRVTETPHHPWAATTRPWAATTPDGTVTAVAIVTARLVWARHVHTLQHCCLQEKQQRALVTLPVHRLMSSVRGTRVLCQTFHLLLLAVLTSINRKLKQRLCHWVVVNSICLLCLWHKDVSDEQQQFLASLAALPQPPVVL